MGIVNIENSKQNKTVMESAQFNKLKGNYHGKMRRKVVSSRKLIVRKRPQARHTNCKE